ncbi:MAG: site-2 protease family protein [Alphaproteobacteria bacterium]|nr:site-2 protease family protein [Alphaproteobacteria bacterium]
MFGRQITLFEILGIQVKIDFSWFFLALLVTWSLAQGFFPVNYEGLPTATYWWMGVAGMIGLFFSLIFHEFSHSLVARQFGLPIRGITLFIFGGVAEMEEEPKSPKAEFYMAIAGPIASFVLAAGFYFIAVIADVFALPLPILGVFLYLALINILLASFNLVPGFPLDGGRVLRSILWQKTGDIRQATRTASRVGEGFGFFLIMFGVFSVLTGNFVGGMWFSLIGLFLRGAASASYYQVIMRKALEGEPVHRFMTTAPVTVSRSLSLREFVESYVYRFYHDMFPVTDDGRVLGCVTVRQLKNVPREYWENNTVGEIMAPCDDGNTIDGDADILQALAVMRQTENSRLMVTTEGRLVGIVTLKDLLKFFALKVELEDADQP